MFYDEFITKGVAVSFEGRDSPLKFVLSRFKVCLAFASTTSRSRTAETTGPVLVTM